MRKGKLSLINLEPCGSLILNLSNLLLEFNYYKGKVIIRSVPKSVFILVY